jgi:hypothetical protein
MPSRYSGAETFDIGMEVGDVQETSLFETDLDKSSLHPRQHARHLTLVDVADQSLAFVALQMELAQHTVFEHRHAHFKRRCVDYNFALHRSDFPDAEETIVNTAQPSGVRPAPACRWSELEVVADKWISRKACSESVGP